MGELVAYLLINNFWLFISFPSRQKSKGFLEPGNISSVKLPLRRTLVRFFLRAAKYELYVGGNNRAGFFITHTPEV